jgi:hypothetical protein
MNSSSNLSGKKSLKCGLKETLSPKLEQVICDFKEQEIAA